MGLTGRQVILCTRIGTEGVGKTKGEFLACSEKLREDHSPFLPLTSLPLEFF